MEPLCDSETHPNVTVDNGLFTVMLGSSGTPITADDLDEYRYVGVKVGDDDEMTPRQRLTSAAYALRADKARSANALDARDGDPENVLMVDYDGNIGINNMFPKGNSTLVTGC